MYTPRLLSSQCRADASTCMPHYRPCTQAVAVSFCSSTVLSLSAVLMGLTLLPGGAGSLPRVQARAPRRARTRDHNPITIPGLRPPTGGRRRGKSSSSSSPTCVATCAATWCSTLISTRWARPAAGDEARRQLDAWPPLHTLPTLDLFSQRSSQEALVARGEQAGGVTRSA